MTVKIILAVKIIFALGKLAWRHFFKSDGIFFDWRFLGGDDIFLNWFMEIYCHLWNFEGTGTSGAKHFKIYLYLVTLFFNFGWRYFSKTWSRDKLREGNCAKKNTVEFFTIECIFFSHIRRHFLNGGSSLRLHFCCFLVCFLIFLSKVTVYHAILGRQKNTVMSIRAPGPTSGRTKLRRIIYWIPSIQAKPFLWTKQNTAI